MMMMIIIIIIVIPIQAVASTPSSSSWWLFGTVCSYDTCKPWAENLQLLSLSSVGVFSDTFFLNQTTKLHHDGRPKMILGSSGAM
jgi:hypothetical protein